MWVHIPAAGGGINVESRQQVLKDMWLREKTVPLAGYSTQRKIQLHNIYRPTLFVSVVCSCKERRINLLSYRHLYGTFSSSLTVAPSWSRRERTALSVSFCVTAQHCSWCAHSCWQLWKAKGRCHSFFWSNCVFLENVASFLLPPLSFTALPQQEGWFLLWGKTALLLSWGCGQTLNPSSVLIRRWAEWTAQWILLGTTWEITRRDRYQCRQLTEVTDGSTRYSWVL